MFNKIKTFLKNHIYLGPLEFSGITMRATLDYDEERWCYIINVFDLKSVDLLPITKTLKFKKYNSAYIYFNKLKQLDERRLNFLNTKFAAYNWVIKCIAEMF